LTGFAVTIIARSFPQSRKEYAEDCLHDLFSSGRRRQAKSNDNVLNWFRWKNEMRLQRRLIFRQAWEEGEEKRYCLALGQAFP